MNQFSFSSEEDRNQSHCLGQEIGFEHIGDWRGNSQEKVQVDEDVQAMLSEFNMDLEEGSQILHNFSKNHECSDIIDTLTPQVHQDQRSVVEKQPSRQAEQTSPTESCPEQTLTFYEQPTQNTTVVRQTLLEQKWQEGGKAPLNQFSAVCKSNYNPLLLNYRQAVKKIKQYNQRSISSLDMYCLFFRIKHAQEQKRLAIVTTLQKQTQQLAKITLLENVYLEQRTVVGELAYTGQKRREESEIFCEQLEESINKIKLLLSKAVQTRKDKFESIQDLLQRIDKTQQELIDLLNRSPMVNDGWLAVSDIKCDRYLQRKYLFQRQSLYLSMIQQLRQKFITLLNTIFVKQDPVIFAVLNRQMIRYKSSSQILYKNHSKNRLPKISTAELDTSLVSLLKDIIPLEWNQFQVSALNCEAMIEKANDYLQNQIFLPVVELNQEYVQIMAPASWLPTLPPNQNSPNTSNQIRERHSEWQTSQALASEKQINNKTPAMSVNVVLTVDKYLHVQCGQQIASLRLKRVKLSRKGRKIIVSQKSRSIATLFGSAKVLGQLQFQNEEISTKFINTVLNNRNL